MPSSTKWRINITATDSVSGDGLGSPTIAEMEMRGSIGGADLCTGGTASASSDDGSNPAAGAFANNADGTIWVAGGLAPQWLEYDFTTAKTIEQVSITSYYGADAPLAFDVQYWDGAAWQTYWSDSTQSWLDNATRVFSHYNPSTAGFFKWRLKITSTHDAGVTTDVAQLQFRVTAGGVDETAPISTTNPSDSFGDVASGFDSTRGAFDNVDGVWTSDTTPSAGTPAYIGYRFSTQKDIQQIVIKSYYLTDAPKAVDVQYYDPTSSTWTTQWSIADTGFTAENQSKTFTGPSSASKTDGIGVSDALSTLATYNVSVVEGIGVAPVLDKDFISGSRIIYDDTLTERVGVNLAQVPAAFFSETLVDEFSSTADVLASMAAALQEQIGVTYRIAALRSIPTTLTDEIDLTDVAATFYGVLVVDRILTSLSTSVGAIYSPVIVDTTRVADLLRPGAPAALTDAIGVALDAQVQQALIVIDALNLQPVIAPLMLYGRTVAETIRLATSLGRFFGGELTEALGILPMLDVYGKRAGTLTEGIGMMLTVTPQWLLQVTVADTIGIDDASILNLLYDGTLADGLEITAGYIAPDGSFTTWAMNTRSGAVTEYSNYAFNSFAQIGDVYYGASDSGLYQLLGDDDAGTDIVAQIKSGFAQWAGSRFTMFKGIYLGVRGEGDWILKLETGDGNTYNYAVSTRNQRTTKVHLGKGLRARYWSFELISTGQDFDLDTIEFVPIVADRRV